MLKLGIIKRDQIFLNRNEFTRQIVSVSYTYQNFCETAYTLLTWLLSTVSRQSNRLIVLQRVVCSAITAVN